MPLRRGTDRGGRHAAGLVALAVKAFDLEAALETAARWPGAAVLTVQNGVGAEAAADAGPRPRPARSPAR